MFWLVDAARPSLIVDLVAGRPDHYLALCQAVGRLGCGSECLGGDDIFDRRDPDPGESAPHAYHDTHFAHFSRLTQAGAIGDMVRGRPVDLLHIDGRQAAQLSDAEVQGWLERLSRNALVVVEDPAHLTSVWTARLSEHPSFQLGGFPNLQLFGLAAPREPTLLPLFTADTAATNTIRATFTRLGLALRDRALARDNAMFATRLEIAVADQAAIADLLRAEAELLRTDQQTLAAQIERMQAAAAERQAADDAERAAMAAEIQRLTVERTAHLARIDTLVPHVTQFHAEVLRLQDYAQRVKGESDRIGEIAHERGVELARLQRQLTERDEELQTAMADRDRQMQAILAERDDELRATLADGVAERENAMLRDADSARKLRQTQHSLDELRHHARRLETELGVLTRSTSWRITGPLRTLLSRFPGVAAWLRRAIKLVWWTISFQLVTRLRHVRHARRQMRTPSPPAGLVAHAAALTTPPGPPMAGGAVEPIPTPAAADLINLASALDTARHQQLEGRLLALESTVELERGRIDDALRAVDGRVFALEPLVGLHGVDRALSGVDSRVLALESLIDLERHRIDHALLGVDGLLSEIDLYQDARKQPVYQKPFDAREPLVSICVATMNRSDLLVERCLNSLTGQSYRNIQIVVVGDHCTDDTASRVAALRDDRIVFRNLPARGPYPPPGLDRWRVAGSNAINAAMELCEGSFVTHLDDDDCATADRIETLVEAAQRHRADFCWHPFWIENPDGSWYLRGDGRFELSQLTTGSMFYHRYFTKFPWDVYAYRMHEPGDWNRLRKIRSLRPRLHFVDRPLMFHYTEGSQPPFVRFNGESFVE